MEIVPRIHLIEGGQANCYLLKAAGLSLIDTGMPHKTKKIHDKMIQ